MDDAAALRRLVDESEIRKVLMTYTRGIDREDADIISSIYHDDAIDFHGSGAGLGKEYGPRMVAAHHANQNPNTKNFGTGHFLGNYLIEWESDDVAHSEIYVRAVSVKEKDGAWTLMLFFGRYLDRFERRDGVWKIAKRVTMRDFQCDIPVTPSMLPRDFEGKRDPSDASYAHFRFEDLAVD